MARLGDHPRLDQLRHILQLSVVMMQSAIDLHRQRRDHRRSRRNFHDLNVRPVTLSDELQIVANPQADLVALLGTLAFAKKIHPHIRNVRPPAEVVVTHQPIEIHGAGGAGEG